VIIAAVVYYAISSRDFRQPELADGAVHGAGTTRPEEAQA
jgi:hypothetical protein